MPEQQKVARAFYVYYKLKYYRINEIVTTVVATHRCSPTHALLRRQAAEAVS